jgi:hypothetical protein
LRPPLPHQPRFSLDKTPRLPKAQGHEHKVFNGLYRSNLGICGVFAKGGGFQQAPPQLGLVVEDVEKVNPDLVVREKEGKPYSVRYDQVNAMLLNEFLKENKAFVEEHREVEQQQKEIDALKTELKEQRALSEKVNDKMELTASASQTIANNQ